MSAKKPPKRIYLQYFGADKGDLAPQSKIEWTKALEITWCEDKIYDTDFEYIRVDRKRESR